MRPTCCNKAQSSVRRVGLVRELGRGVYISSVDRSSNHPLCRCGPFFLLGAGFMLVETKNITELGLGFGNSWQVILPRREWGRPRLRHRSGFGWQRLRHGGHRLYRFSYRQCHPAHQPRWVISSFKHLARCIFCPAWPTFVLRYTSGSLGKEMNAEEFYGFQARDLSKAHHSSL